MSPEGFRQNGECISKPAIDSLLKELINKAVCSEKDSDRQVAQGHLQTYLADHPLALEGAAAYFGRLLEQKKASAGMGLQETFPILFTNANKNSLNEKLLANTVFVLASTSNERLYEKTSANIDAALALRPDFKKVVEDEKKRLPARASSARSAERRASIYAVISSL